MAPVRTRFAPSPTGFLHIGSVRTALWAFLSARHYGGQFLLRVEDTDQDRLVPGALKYAIEELAWFGIVPDEGPSHEELASLGELWEGAPKLGGGYGPYIQSLRKERYKEIAEKLVADGHAYRCDCTPEMLEKERLEQMARKELPGYSGYCRSRNISKDVPHVIRFKMPVKRSITLNDAVKGKVVWDTVPLRDPILFKTEGLPTYHLAVVVDDHDMEITHVHRGEEWLSSAPLHLLVYEALGWEPPVFAHLPVVLGANGRKLSKRDGDVGIHQLRAAGYLPEALSNYVCLVGWSAGEGVEQEVFTRQELIERFTLEGINSASGVFDFNKLQWMNGVYIRALSDGEFVDRSYPYLAQKGLALDKVVYASIAPHLKERVKVLAEVCDMVDFLCLDEITRDLPAMFQKGVEKAKALEIVEKGRKVLAELPDFTVEACDKALRQLAADLGLKVGPTFVVIRIAVTGKTVTPPLFESLVALGREKTLKRFDEALVALNAYQAAA